MLRRDERLCEVPALMDKSGSQRAFDIPDGPDISCTCLDPSEAHVLQEPIGLEVRSCGHDAAESAENSALQKNKTCHFQHLLFVLIHFTATTIYFK